jgi:serine/threonine-protein kinase
MGCVFAATHLELDTIVAVKVLLPNRALDAASRLRLVREARVSARVKSEHVVRVFDVVGGGPGPAYIVMEYLEGQDLARRLREGALGVREAVEIVVQACEAVGEAHRLGIVHRDLKPSNLFLCSRPGKGPLVKVLDFGISKTDAAGIESITKSRSFVGSPAYASPEQLRAANRIGARTDIWSLGVILYECTTGKPPFSGRNLAQVCTDILDGAPALPRALRGEIPSSLERVILRCLEKDPARRFGSVEGLVVALRDHAPGAARACTQYLRELPLGDGSRGLTQPDPSETGFADGPTLTSTSLTRRAKHPRSPRGRVDRRIVGALVIGVVCVGWWAVRSRAVPVRAATDVAPEIRVAVSGEGSVAQPPVSASASAAPPAPADTEEQAPASPSRARRPASPPAPHSVAAVAPAASPPRASGANRDAEPPWVDSR